MSTTPQTTLQLARQGNPEAIAALMNRHLEAQGITAQVVQQDGTLRVSLEADQVPNQSELVAYVKKGITGLELAHIDHLTVMARQPGTDAHAWSEDLSLQPQSAPRGSEFNAPSDADLDLDFDLNGPALEVQSLDDLDAVLDSGLEGTDLDFDLGFTDSDDPGLASIDDFDLNFADGDLDLSETSAATDVADLDLSLEGSDLDFDLGLDDAATADAGFDFDLGLTDAAAEPPADLDFDLGFADSSAEAPLDLGFDLELADTFGEDLDLGGAVPSTGGDFDLGADSTAMDLDLDLGAESDATSFNFESVDLNFDADSDLAAELGLDPGDTTEFDLDLGGLGEDEEAIAAPDGADFALDFTSDTPSDALASDLDDLWESDNTDAPSPDLGFTAADSGSAWEADGDFPPLDDMAPLDDLGSPSEVAASGDDLADLDFEPISAELESAEFDLEGFEPEGFETVEFDLTGLSSENLAQEAFVAEILDAEAITTEAPVLPDLDFHPDADLDDVSPDLRPAENMDFANLGSAEILDLSSPDSDADFAELDPSAPVEADLDSYLSSGAEAFADTPTDWGADAEVDLEPSEDLGLYTYGETYGEVELTTDPLVDLSEGATPDLAWDSGLEAADDSAFVSDTAPPWGEAQLDPDLTLDNREDAGFDPGLVFDPAAETSGMAESDFPFDSTMELDKTVEGDFIVPGEFGDDATSMADSPFVHGEEAAPSLSFDNTDEDLAFESVELDVEDVDPRYRAAGFAAAGRGQGVLGEADFDDESFDDESFAPGLFSDSASDSNGFIQDTDALPLVSDEPDATDDFVQEFGTDPSTHVSLTPDQFDKDGSVKSSSGSGLPMRLILGLGLGALILALAGLVLNGLVGRMRQPAPDAPAVTEPEVPTPDAPVVTEPEVPTPDAAPVAETDFFREAVNAAQNAANQAQTAGTSAQWQAVADSWARAIELMQQVPQSDPNYAVAQQKAVEYQPNRNYAQQNADRLR